MIFSIYNTTSGAIRQTLEVPTFASMAANVMEGEAAIFGEYDPAVFYIVGGEPVRKPDRPPGSSWIFDTHLGAWIDTRSEAEIHDAAREDIRMRRDLAIAAGTRIAGIQVGTDDVTQTRIMGAAMSAMIDPNYTVAWKDWGGAFVTLTGQEVLAVATAIRAHVQGCFDREAALLAALAAGQSYDIDADWPG